MIYPYVPSLLSRILWGDRDRHGREIIPDDPDWMRWTGLSFDFYETTQRGGLAERIVGLAYSVMASVDFEGLEVMEFGPGVIAHLDHVEGRPKMYMLADISSDCLAASEKILDARGIPGAKALLDCSDPVLPFEDDAFDVVVSFNTLEHLYPLDRYLDEMARVLKPGGRFVGGIPCEGGLLWGLGRALTTRRLVTKRLGLDYDKIICWGHPNFADHILEHLEARFGTVRVRRYPFHWLPMDCNLAVSFSCVKR